MRESNKIFSQGVNNNNPASQNMREVVKDDFNWEVPVELVPVPSEGKVYGKETGLFGIQGLEIKAMTAREEDILTSRALIKKGTVISELVSACLLNKNVDVGNLLVGDRDSLMVSIRITGYGTNYNATVECPSCGTVHKDHEFDLAQLEIKRLELNPISEGINEFEYTLPVSKKTVVFKFLTINDDIQLTRERERKQALFGSDYIAGTVTETLGAHIVSIDGIRDRSKISMFINKMPALDSSSLRKYIKKYKPGLDMRAHLHCSNCNAHNRIELPIGISFFGLPSNFQEIKLEYFYFLQKNLGMSYTEITNLPVRYRSWYINRIMEDFQKQKEALEQNSNQIELKRPDESFQKMYKRFSKE